MLNDVLKHLHPLTQQFKKYLSKTLVVFNELVMYRKPIKTCHAGDDEPASEKI